MYVGTFSFKTSNQGPVQDPYDSRNMREHTDLERVGRGKKIINYKLNNVDLWRDFTRSFLASS
jgi:hypothetical protein